MATDLPELLHEGKLPTKEQLADKWWRLNSLYKIVDKNGCEVIFRANEAQCDLWANRHYRQLILKSRQVGFTTFIQLWFLDECLWNPNVQAGTIFHRLDDAKAAMRNKIRYALDRLPDWAKALFTITKATETTISFGNGSFISVGTSHRGSTLHLLHVSEHGKICAQYPLKAEEIKTGALNTVPTDGMIFIESTAEGSFGDYHDMVQSARGNDGLDLTSMDWRLFFTPWLADPTCRLAGISPIPAKIESYCDQKERELGVTLDQDQRRFYAKKAAEQGEKVRQEFPSTIDEAFSANSEAQIFAPWLDAARDKGRISDAFEPLPGLPCYTIWDLGVRDFTAIWWMQVNPEDGFRTFLNYYESQNRGLEHYVRKLAEVGDELEIFYGPVQPHKVPHDAEQRRLGPGELPISVMSLLRDKGLADKFEPLPAPPSKWALIGQTRDQFPRYRFHKTRCEKGLARLRAYRRQFIKSSAGGHYADEPYHDEASDAADAFMLQVNFSPTSFADYSGMDLRPRITGVY